MSWLKRLVTIALAIALVAFFSEVVWPVLDDDPPTMLQTTLISGGVILTTLGAILALGGPR